MSNFWNTVAVLIIPIVAVASDAPRGVLAEPTAKIDTGNQRTPPVDATSVRTAVSELPANLKSLSTKSRGIFLMSHQTIQGGDPSRMPQNPIPVPPSPTEKTLSTDSNPLAAGTPMDDSVPDRLRSIRLVTLNPQPANDEDSSDRPDNRAKRLNSVQGVRFADSGFIGGVSRPPRNSYPICHKPLYFEDPNLERCGRGHGCMTDAVSLARFAGRIPLFPYMATVRPPNTCVLAKPDCPTCHKFGADAYVPNPSEVDLGAASVQAAVCVGLVFLIP